MRVIRKRGFKNIKSVVLLNDTVASLLSGISSFQDREFSGYIGLVLGTGMNACYIEKNSNIKGDILSGLPREGYQLINIEAGQYLKGPLSKIDKIFDAKTLNPALSTFEKMFSGAYLGGLAHTVLGIAAAAGLFSEKFTKDLHNLESLNSRDLDDYLYFPPENKKLADLVPGMSEKDKVVMYYLFDSLVERAAMLTSIVLSASAIKEGTGYNPCAPICIVAEGSSFHKMKNFKVRVEHYLNAILSKYRIKAGVEFTDCQNPIYYEIHAVEEATLKGAAAAALA
jgi:hexokinase